MGLYYPGGGGLLTYGGRAYTATAADSLDLFTRGTFTRASEGSRLIAAPTDGSTPFLGWEPNDVRRLEYDANLPGGQGLLIEGSRTNYAIRNRDPANAAWSAGSLSSLTTGLAGPDSALLAAWWQVSSGGYSKFLTGMTGPANCVTSEWIRLGAADPSYQMTAGTGTSFVGATSGLTSAYMRISLQHAATGTAIIPCDGRLGAIPAEAHSVITDLAQIEAGFFATSAIRTAGAPVTRAPDVLTCAAGQYPLEFVSRGMRLMHCPGMSPSQMISSGQGETLISFGGGAGLDRIMLSFSGATAYVYIFDSDTHPGGVQCGPLTWTAGLPLTITARPSVGRVTIAGALTGNGTYSITPWAWPTGTLYIGSALGIVSTFGRFGRYIEVP